MGLAHPEGTFRRYCALEDTIHHRSIWCSEDPYFSGVSQGHWFALQEGAKKQLK